MKIFRASVVLTLFADSLAAPSPLDLHQPANQLCVTLQHQRATSKTSISITDKATSEFLGYTCSNSLKSGATSTFPVAVHVDAYGAGNITVNDRTYRVHDNPELLRGITCMRICDHKEILVKCDDVPLPASSLGRCVNNIKKDNCFDESATVMRLHMVLVADDYA
ncbi:hypothetical protein BDW59DRAFT_166265 [Aspergillus cavernicola]|uniref:Cyanovirin-N domain-containing protein n=1 Tax=Aspergillus cavernicola TaxID=176166 RepID=A0ABR4HMB5_9EURO